MHSKTETYSALKLMVASLGDRYTEFLGPTQARRLPRTFCQQHALALTLCKEESWQGLLTCCICAVSSAVSAGVEAAPACREGLPGGAGHWYWPAAGLARKVAS